MYDKKFVSLKEEIKEDIDKWKALPQSWLGRINILKMSKSPKDSMKALSLSKSQHNASQNLKGHS